uniref:Xrn1 N-terminal domain-containing protein n=1 Tax=viral metagenome TaxID=1070528 RepID=A0A6C0HNJ7_9ZZZZ
MGVPLLFSTLVRTYNDKNDAQTAIIKPTMPTDILPTHLFLDFNAGIYQAILPEIKTEDTLVLHTIAYLDLLATKIIKNLEVLFIALDGVVCRGKQMQQRDRRFHSVCKRNRTLKINKQFGTELDFGNISNIDTNMITPGTTFMTKLSKAIRNYITNSKELANVRVIFSDASVPGEGEHKIIQYIKANKTDINNDYRGSNENHNTVIYGLDADLILLGLSASIDNLYLLREANEYGNFSSIYEGRKYLYLDLNVLKIALIDNFAQYGGPIEARKHKALIDDYVFLSMLFGNDFMPKIHWMSLSNGGYEKWLSAYWQIHNHTEEYLVNLAAMTINTEMLGDIMFLIKEQEHVNVLDLFAKRKKLKIRISNEMSEREKQQTFADFFPLQHLNVEQTIQPEKPGWQDRYYSVCFNIVPTIINKSQIANCYLRTLVWNFLYYFDEIPSWDWYYPYAYAPTMSDIYDEIIKVKNINPGGNKDFAFTIGEPVSAQTLLLMVLPWASKGLMARDISVKLESDQCPMKIYFPHKYGLNVAFNRYYHECVPNIYKMDLKKVHTFIKTIKFTEDELARNETGQVFTNFTPLKI